METRKIEQFPQSDAIQRAVEYGVDISLLLENLKRTPTERLRKTQRALESVLAFRAEVKSSRMMREAKREYDAN